MTKKTSNAGRKRIAPEDKVKPLPVYAKVKNHKVLAEKFQPLIKKAEEKLEKDAQQYNNS